MADDTNIPVLTDLIERGDSGNESSGASDNTDLLIEDTDGLLDNTEVTVDQATEIEIERTELSISLPAEEEEETDSTEMLAYENVDDVIETDSSSVDLLIETGQSDKPVELSLVSSATGDQDEADAELEETIQRIIDKHMDRAMHEIRLALQLRKR